MSAQFVLGREDSTDNEIWDVPRGLFHWVVEFLADHVADRDLAEALRKFIAGGYAWLSLTSYSGPQAVEIVRVIRESLMEAAEKEFPFNEHRAGVLEAIDELVEMATRWSGTP